MKFCIKDFFVFCAVNFIISNEDILVTLVNVTLLEEKRKKHSPGGVLLKSCS